MQQRFLFRSFPLVVFAILVPAGDSDAHSVFSKPFRERYEYRSVTCYACHLKGKDKKGKPLGKEVLNDLGKSMKKSMAKRDFTKRINDAKKSGAKVRKKVNTAVATEFVEALKTWEKNKSPDGQTWERRLEDGGLEGMKRAKPTSTEKKAPTGSPPSS